MRKTILALLLLCAGTAASLKSQEAKTLFINMPDSLLPVLTKVNRADCIDFLESNMKAVVDNRLDGKSEMTALRADYLSIRLSEQQTWQMKVLQVNDSTQIIATISTAFGPAADSHFQFYTTDWKALPDSAYITLPTRTDAFIHQPDSASSDYAYQDIRLKADILFMQADFSSPNNRLVLSCTTGQYMNQEDAEKLKPYLKELVYEWDREKKRLENIEQ